MPKPLPPSLVSVGMLSMWQHCGSGFSTQSHSCDAIKNAHGHSTWFYILPRELVESERAKLEGYKSAHRRFSPSPQTTHPNHLLFCQKPSCYLCCMYLLPCRLLPQGCYPVIVVVAVSDFLTLAATMSRASTSIPCSSFFIAISTVFFLLMFSWYVDISDVVVVAGLTHILISLIFPTTRGTLKATSGPTSMRIFSLVWKIVVH